MSEKPNIVVLTSRRWHEWIVKDEALLSLANPKLINTKEGFNLAEISTFNPDFIFVPHWSFFVPSAIFTAYKVVIFHMTDLPYGRGGSPLQNLILAGHKKTRISAIECSAEFDAGPVYCKSDLELFGSAEEIFLRSSPVIRDMIVRILTERMSPIPQIGTITQFKRRLPPQSNLTESGKVNPSEIYDFIRMLDAPGYPKAYIQLGKLKIELSEVIKKQNCLKGSFEIKEDPT